MLHCGLRLNGFPELMGRGNKQLECFLRASESLTRIKWKRREKALQLKINLQVVQHLIKMPIDFGNIYLADSIFYCFV